MRTIPPALAAHLAGGITTLCTCWRVIRRDGVTIGFTEHDHDLTFGGFTHLAASGFAASASETETGLAAPTGEVAGGFSNDAISEADLVAGRYDGARVEVFRVNWQAPEQHLLLRVQEIGEVTRETGQFIAELRGFAHRLNQEQGRIYNRRCDATLGDARCGVDLLVAGRHADGTVTAIIDAGRIVISGIAGFANGHFRFGRLRFLSGPAAGVEADVESNVAVSGGAELALWLPLAVLPQVGDTLRLIVGCDKAFATCRNRFANQRNFRGFPHMPGTDFAYSYADGTSLHDGSPIYR